MATTLLCVLVLAGFSAGAPGITTSVHSQSTVNVNVTNTASLQGSQTSFDSLVSTVVTIIITHLKEQGALKPDGFPTVEFNNSHFQSEGDSCKLSNKDTGICSKVYDCPIVFPLIQQGARPKICSFDRFIPIVCCPTDNPQHTEEPYYIESLMDVPQEDALRKKLFFSRGRSIKD